MLGLEAVESLIRALPSRDPKPNKNSLRNKQPFLEELLIEKEEQEPHFNLTKSYLDKNKRTILKLVDKSKLTLEKPFKKLSDEEFIKLYNEGKPFLYITDTNQTLHCDSTDTKNTIYIYMNSILRDIHRLSLYDNNEGKFVGFTTKIKNYDESINDESINDESIKDAPIKKKSIKVLLFNYGMFFNYMFNTDTDYISCLNDSQINEMTCNKCVLSKDICTKFTDLSIANLSETNYALSETNEMCIPNLKKLLYNISQFFQSYHAEILDIIAKYCDFGLDTQKCDYMLNLNNIVRYFDKDDKGNKIIYIVFYCTGNLYTNPLQSVFFGYIVKVFYVDDYGSYAYYYIDLKTKHEPIPMTNNGGSRENTKRKTKYKRRNTLKRKSKIHNSKHKKLLNRKSKLHKSKLHKSKLHK